jgi:hypothetical protein
VTPISAKCPSTRAYRLKKFVTAHRDCDLASAIKVEVFSSIWLLFRVSRESPSPMDASGDLSIDIAR